jgi:exosortase H (IPTLxxWG-CTERM-specific)
MQLPPLVHRNRAVLRHWATFFPALLSVHGLVLFGGEGLIDRATRANAAMSAWLLRALGADGRAEGRLVTSALMEVQIIFECTAVYPIGIFAAAVLAYPATWRARLAGLAMGIPAIVAVNLCRIVSLCYIGHWYPGAFETAHLVVWQSLVIFLTFLFWVIWVVGLAGGRRAPV